MKILIDKNEKTPYRFPDSETKKLFISNSRYSVDYTIEGYEKLIAVERKSLSDFYQSVGRNHDKFFKKMEF